MTKHYQSLQRSYSVLSKFRIMEPHKSYQCRIPAWLPIRLHPNCFHYSEIDFSLRSRSGNLRVSSDEWLNVRRLNCYSTESKNSGDTGKASSPQQYWCSDPERQRSCTTVSQNNLPARDSWQNLRAEELVATKRTKGRKKNMEARPSSSRRRICTRSKQKQSFLSISPMAYNRVWEIERRK